VEVPVPEFPLAIEVPVPPVPLLVIPDPPEVPLFEVPYEEDVPALAPVPPMLPLEEVCAPATVAKANAAAKPAIFSPVVIFMRLTFLS
jgi:hypothetical protein